MKVLVMFALALLLITLTIILMLVAYMLFTDICDEFEWRKKIRQTERSE